MIHKGCGGEVIDGTSAQEYPEGDIQVFEERTCLRCGASVQDLDILEDDDGEAPIPL